VGIAIRCAHSRQGSRWDLGTGEIDTGSGSRRQGSNPGLQGGGLVVRTDAYGTFRLVRLGRGSVRYLVLRCRIADGCRKTCDDGGHLEHLFVCALLGACGVLEPRRQRAKQKLVMLLSPPRARYTSWVSRPSSQGGVPASPSERVPVREWVSKLASRPVRQDGGPRRRVIWGVSGPLAC